MSSLRVAAFVSGGPIAQRATLALAAAHQLVAVIRPLPAEPIWRALARRLARAGGLLPPDSVDQWAQANGVPVIRAAAGQVEATAARIRALRPDVGCIATWPRRLPESLIAACGTECLNLHTSLLPRHRGANPLFWTYHEGDAAAGVSIHRVTSRLDAGAVLRQQPVPFERGESVTQVHARCAEAGATLLVQSVTAIAEGSASFVEQDENRATPAPSPVPGRSYADLRAWSCAQSWHFLAGLLSRYRDPLRDDRGAPVSYERVEGYEAREGRRPAGTVERNGAGWLAWATDGVVHLAGGTQEGHA